MEPQILVRNWISEVIRAHPALVALAVRQRAKFEGWLKFELAMLAELRGAQSVEVETRSKEDQCRTRSDLSFSYDGKRCQVELKTCNTNWRTEGVLNRTRPITKNLAGIVADAKKMMDCPDQGIVAFCMFPLPSDDKRWVEYLDRISNELGLVLTAYENAERISIPIGGECKADVIVVAFAVPRNTNSASVTDRTPPTKGYSELGTAWPDPSKQEIHLECPPGDPRPGDLIADLIKDTGLPIRPDISRVFGHWTWDYSDIPQDVWQRATPIVIRRMEELYDRGVIRAGDCTGFTSESALGL